MRANEFIVEDVEQLMFIEFQKGYNEYLIENNFLLEGFAEADAIINFAKEVSIEPKIGGRYCALTIQLPLFSGHKFMSIKCYKNPMTIIEISSTNQIIIRDEITKTVYKFPEIIGPAFDKSSASILFKNSTDVEHWMTLLRIKFGDWKITTNESK